MSLITEIDTIIKRHLPADLQVSTETTEMHCLQVEACRIHYRSGNEFLPLSVITDDLRKLGKVLVEYRGRGSREAPQIVFDVVADNGRAASIHWYLG